MPKQARLNGIKAFRCYTIEEAADVSGVSPRTIRSWANDGLPVMDSTRPLLIRGDALRKHIKTKRKGRSVKTQIDTFYCVRCRQERRAAEGLADCEIKGGRATVTALCEVCEMVLFKPIAKARVPDLRKILDLKVTRQ